MKSLKFILPMIGILNISGAFAAGVVQRNTVAPNPVSRANTTTRMGAAIVLPVAPIADKPEIIDNIVAPVPVPEITIENKSDQFGKALTATTATATDSAANARAEIVRAQRAALDANSKTDVATEKMGTALSSNTNLCDTGLRTCMAGVCGNDFSKCAGDGDTDFGAKLNTCRRDLPCDSNEFTVFSAEIRADMNMNMRVKSYDDTIKCGDDYKTCIFSQCGTKFEKCLSKSAGDLAISNCGATAKNCQTLDNGMANRMGQVFGTLRTSAELSAAANEKKLYALREEMASRCDSLGAMFDERTLDCVFTVNFITGTSKTPMASKKLYAGNSFNCTSDWFGIDTTTYRENAMRLTRSQTSASNALMGAGLGVATGAVAGGTIDRAMDTARANKALKSAQGEKTAPAPAPAPAQDTVTPAPSEQNKTGTPPPQPDAKQPTDSEKELMKKALFIAQETNKEIPQNTNDKRYFEFNKKIEWAEKAGKA